MIGEERGGAQMVGGQMVQNSLLLPNYHQYFKCPNHLYSTLTPTQSYTSKVVFCQARYANCCITAQNYPYQNNPNIATRVKSEGPPV